MSFLLLVPVCLMNLVTAAIVENALAQASADRDVNEARGLPFANSNFANFRRARSRLCQNEFLQEYMRLTAFFKLYQICILLHRCNLKI